MNRQPASRSDSGSLDDSMDFGDFKGATCKNGHCNTPMGYLFGQSFQIIDARCKLPCQSAVQCTACVADVMAVGDSELPRYTGLLRTKQGQRS